MHECFRNAGQGGLTADEAADRLGHSVLTVRPRVAELKRLGKIEATGERRKNTSGASALVWRVKDTYPKATP